jgi:hypothetical protein
LLSAWVTGVTERRKAAVIPPTASALSAGMGDRGLGVHLLQSRIAELARSLREAGARAPHVRRLADVQLVSCQVGALAIC